MKVKIGTHKSCLYQWDTGQFVVIDGAEQCNEIHFCNDRSKNALVVKITEQDGKRIANIPNILLQNDGSIYAYLFARNEDGSETRTSASFPVRGRKKPENYVYTETEKWTYDNIERRLDDLEDSMTHGTVKSVNGLIPDANGNVEIEIPEGITGSGVVVSETEPEDTSVLWIDLNDNDEDKIGEPNQVLTINQDGTDSWEYPLIIDATKTEGYQHVINKSGIHQELLCIDIAKPVLGIYRMSNYQDSVVYPYVRIVNGDTILVSSMSLGVAAAHYIDVFEVNDKYVQFRVFVSNGHCSSYLYDVAENSWTDRKLLYAASYVDFILSQKITAPNTASVGQVLAVKAVDENGKPTDWETADASSGIDEESTTAIDDLIELGFIEPAVGKDNSFFVDKNGNVYIY